jgi:DNA-binding transcriptional LysR family regulator
MDLRNLRYFAEVALRGSVSQAAATLGRSQPALTKSIHDLEAELELSLFERAGRRMVLTPGGVSLLERVRPLLAEVEQLREHARMLASGKTMVLRLGGASNIIERVLPDVLRLYRQRHPQVEVRLKLEGGTQLLFALEKGEIDVAITRQTHGAYLRSEAAFPIYAMAAIPAGHRLSRRRSVAIDDLFREPLLTAPPSVTSRRLLELAFLTRGMRPRIAVESHEVNALLALAQAEQGVAVVPSTADPQGRGLHIAPIYDGHQPLGTWMAIVWNKHTPPREPVSAFVQLACDVLRRHYPGKDFNLPHPETRDLSDIGTGSARRLQRRAAVPPRSTLDPALALDKAEL